MSRTDTVMPRPVANIDLSLLTPDGRTRQGKLQGKYPQYPIGRCSYGDLTVLAWDNDTEFSVGAFCSFASGVQLLLGGEHRVDWATTYPFNAFWAAAKYVEGHPTSKGDVTIGNDVWVGRDALILSGVTIGDGAVIGARSVVSCDVPPYAVFAGSPARLVKIRFEAATVTRLLTLKWWDWPDKKIEKFLPLMLSGDIKKFLDAAEKKNGD